MLYKHELDADHRTHIYQNHFQDGDGAFQYLITVMRTPIDRLQLRELDDKWAKVDILQDVGVQENTILLITTKIKALNAKRPISNRKSQTECTERLLECIFTTSKHFSETALNEYNAVGAARRFVIAAGLLAGQRDFNACATHFHALWKAAVKSKMPGFHVRAPTARPASNTRTTIEAGLVTDEGEREHALRAEAGGNDTYVPRAGSPSRSLERVADAGDDLASRHGSTTTTDFGMLTEEEICAVCEGGLEGEFETLHLFDADGRGSVEIICDNCRGLGHMRRVCPSNRNRSRSLDYAIAALQSKKTAAGSAPPRRPPGPGQRPPFTAQPRRFQPARRADGSRFARPTGRGRGRGRAYSAEEGDTDEEIYSAESDGTRSETGSLWGGSSSSAGGSSHREKLASVKEAEPIKQPLTFSDDALYERESLNVARESGSAEMRAAAVRAARPWGEGGTRRSGYDGEDGTASVVLYENVEVEDGHYRSKMCRKGRVLGFVSDVTDEEIAEAIADVSTGKRMYWAHFGDGVSAYNAATMAAKKFETDGIPTRTSRHGGEQWSLVEVAYEVPVTATEEVATRPHRFTPLVWLLACCAAAMAVATSVLEGAARMVTCLGVVGVTGVIAMSVLVETAPVERLLPCREEGYITMFDRACATVDSGATSTAVSEARDTREHLLKKVTKIPQNEKIYIANDDALKIVKIGEWDMCMPGFELIAEDGVHPSKWKQVPCEVTLPSSRTLVVRGLADDIILLSVKGMKRDGIKTFLNDLSSDVSDAWLSEPIGATALAPALRS